MQGLGLAEHAKLISRVAYEAAEESDAIERHPQVIEALSDLAGTQGEELYTAFGANGHDPVAFVHALAEGLEPYRTQPLEDQPELVSGLGLVGWTLRHHVANGNGSSPA